MGGRTATALDVPSFPDRRRKKAFRLPDVCAKLPPPEKGGGPNCLNVLVGLWRWPDAKAAIASPSRKGSGGDSNRTTETWRPAIWSYRGIGNDEVSPGLLAPGLSVVKSRRIGREIS